MREAMIVSLRLLRMLHHGMLLHGLLMATAAAAVAAFAAQVSAALAAVLSSAGWVREGGVTQ